MARSSAAQARPVSPLASIDERYRDLLALLPAVVVLAGGGEEPAPAAELAELLGQEPRGARARRWREAIHADDREGIVAERERCIAERLPFRADYRLLDAQGRALRVRHVERPSGRRYDGVIVALGPPGAEPADDPLHALVEAIPAVAYMRAAADETPLDVSGALLPVLGVERDEWLADAGLHERLVLDDDRARLRDARVRLESGAGRLDITYRMRAADGSLRCIREIARLARAGGQRLVHGLLLDVTEERAARERARRAELERRRVERVLGTRARQQQAAAELGLRALEEPHLDVVLEEAVGVVQRILELELVAVLELEPDGEGLVMRTGAGYSPTIIGLRVPAGRGSPAGYALATDAPVIVGDLAGERRFSPPHAMLDEGACSGISVKIPGTPRPFGVLGAYSRRRRRLTGDDAAFLQAAANVLGAAADRAAGLRAREAAERRAAERARQQEAVARLGQVALEEREYQPLLESAVSCVAETLEVETVVVLALRPDGTLEVEGGTGLSADATERRIPGHPDSAAGRVLASDRPLIIDDMHAFKAGGSVFDPRYRSAMAVKIADPARPSGVLGVASSRPRTFTMDDAHFLQAVAHVLAAARERDEASRALQESEELRQRVLSELLRSADAERSRIAGELHDDTIQVLTAALLSLDRQARAHEQGDLERALRMGRTARETLAAAVERTRRLTFELRPPLLEAQGLAAAVRELVDQTARDAGFEAEVRVRIPRFPESVESLGYRTVQELVANVRKHAHARRVTVLLRERAGRLLGEVRDDGRGFDVSRALDRSANRLHFGLDATAERIRVAGGRLDLESQPGHGTRVRFTIPLDEAARVRERPAAHT